MLGAPRRGAPFREPPHCSSVSSPAPGGAVVSAGSAAWRARVDAAIDPRFEQAFAILDAVHAERQRPASVRDAARVLQLRRELAQLLAVLDGVAAPRGRRDRT